MKILFFLMMIGLLFIAFILLFGFSFLRFLFGSHPKSQNKTSNQQKKKQTNKQQNTSSIKKIFKHDEGEYIDYEEIKE